MRKPCSNCEYANPYELKKRIDWQCFSTVKRDNCQRYKDYKTYLVSRRKYTKGELITSMNELEECLERDGFIYLCDKVIHQGWVLGMQYRFIRDQIIGRRIYRAIRKGENQC